MSRSRPMGKFLKIAKLTLEDDKTLVLWRHARNKDKLLLRHGNLFAVIIKQGVSLHNSTVDDDALQWASRALRYAAKYKRKNAREIGAMAFDNPDGLF